MLNISIFKTAWALMSLLLWKFKILNICSIEILLSRTFYEFTTSVFTLKLNKMIHNALLWKGLWSYNVSLEGLFTLLGSCPALSIHYLISLFTEKFFLIDHLQFIRLRFETAILQRFYILFIYFISETPMRWLVLNIITLSRMK